jgi:hypothetical protein
LNKFALFFFFFFFSLKGQTNTHINSWSRLSIAFRNQESRWKFESEFQRRTQNNGSIQNNINPFDENLMQSFRFWMHHKKKNTPLNYLFSPIGYFEHTPIIKEEQDMIKNRIYEYRISAALDYKVDLFSRISVFMRPAIEFRDFQNKPWHSILRLRGKTGFKIDLNSKLSINVFDELFLNINSDDKKHIFDHNRIGTILNYYFNDSIKLEMGYIAISKLQRNDIDIMFENNFLFMLYYTLNTKK